MSKHDELVTELWTKYVKPMKLPPRLSGQIKHALEEAAKSSKGDRKATRGAIAAYLKERGYDPETGKKLDKPKGKRGRKKKEATTSDDSEAAPKKAKKKRKGGDDDPARDAVEKVGGKKALKGDADAGVPKGNIDLRKLTRQTLKGMAVDLGLKVKKKWSDDELRLRVAKNMIGLDDATLVEIAKIDPSKVDAMRDCIGILLDLTKAICITCPAQVDCRKLFEEHRKDGFKIFQGLQPGTHDITKLVPAEGLKKKLKKKEGEPITLTWNPAQKIDVFEFAKVKTLPKVEVDGKPVKNMEHKAFLRSLKKAVPATLGEFRDAVLTHYNAKEDDTDGINLVSWFVRYCTALEIIKLT
jgi:hypothetical protein